MHALRGTGPILGFFALLKVKCQNSGDLHLRSSHRTILFSKSPNLWLSLLRGDEAAEVLSAIDPTRPR